MSAKPPYNGGTGSLSTAELTIVGLLDPVRFHLSAASGDLVAEMLVQAPTEMDPYYDPLVPLNVAVLWAGGNDIDDIAAYVGAGGMAGATAIEAHERIRTWCEERQAVGFRVMICTQLPRSNGVSTPESYEPRRIDLNNMIRAFWPQYADAICDIAADPLLGDSGDETNMTLFHTDETHLLEEGRIYAAAILREALGQLGIR